MAGKYQQLQSQIAKLQQEAAAVRKVEAAEAVATIKALIAEFDLTADDLGFKSTRTAKKATQAKAAGTPKYRDPQTGNTWTGRGKPPAWMTGPLKAGTAEALLIKTEAAPTGATAKKTRTASQDRGDLGNCSDHRQEAQRQGRPPGRQASSHESGCAPLVRRRPGTGDRRARGRRNHRLIRRSAPSRIGP